MACTDPYEATVERFRTWHRRLTGLLRVIEHALLALHIPLAAWEVLRTDFLTKYWVSYFLPASSLHYLLKFDRSVTIFHKGTAA